MLQFSVLMRLQGQYFATPTGGGRARCRDLLPGTLASLAILAAAALSRHHRLALPRLPPPAPDQGRFIDAVVPARDEAASIAGCVGALQRSPGVASVTVVDDASDDATAELAGRAGARVIRSGGPPPGWLGKPHACSLGAAGATSEWLAFVDADVRLAPGTLAALVSHCRETGAAAASPLLRQRCSRPADRLLVPLAYWQYLVGLPGLFRPAGAAPPRAILNGQCLVVSRAAYLACGGHASDAVRASVAEDSALARRLAASGFAVALLLGTEAGEVSMYRGLAEVRAGFGKNIADLLAADPARALPVALAGVALSSLPCLAARAVRRRSWPALAGALAAYAAGTAALSPAYREAGEPRALALAHPLAAAAMQAIALESLLRTAIGRRPRWRGRRLD